MRTCELGLATVVSNFELEARDEKMKEGAVILVVDNAARTITIIMSLVRQKQKAVAHAQCCRQWS